MGRLQSPTLLHQSRGRGASLKYDSNNNYVTFSLELNLICYQITVGHGEQGTQYCQSECHFQFDLSQLLDDSIFDQSIYIRQPLRGNTVNWR